MSSAGGNKWNDAAVKDLTFAILMSNSDGNLNIDADWDNVHATMNKWGYSLPNQHWSKRILKEFKERRADETGNAIAGPSSTTSTPRGNKAHGRASSAADAPKTPASKGKVKGSGSGKGKGKRAAEDDSDNEANDTSPESTNSTVNPIVRSKTPRGSVSAKRVKYEEVPEVDEDGEPIENPVYPMGHGSRESDPAFEGV